MESLEGFLHKRKACKVLRDLTRFLIMKGMAQSTEPALRMKGPGLQVSDWDGL